MPATDVQVVTQEQQLLSELLHLLPVGRLVSMNGCQFADLAFQQQKLFAGAQIAVGWLLEAG